MKHPMMVRTTPRYFTDSTLETGFLTVSVTETSKAQFVVCRYFPSVTHCHFLEAFARPQTMSLVTCLGGGTIDGGAYKAEE